MNNPKTHYGKGQMATKVSLEQEAIIKMYAKRVGEKIGKLVSEIIIDSQILLRV